MPTFAHNPQTGEILVQDPLSGEWQAATQAQVRAANTGVGESLLRGAQNTVNQVRDLIRVGFNDIQPTAGGEFFTALQQERPFATGLGSILPDLLLGGPLLGATRGRVASRVAEATAEQAAPSARRFTRDFGDVVRDRVPGVAGRVAGSAADQLQAGLQAIPIARAFAQIPFERRAGEFNAIVVRAMGGDPRTALDSAGRLSRPKLNEIVQGIEGRFRDAVIDGDRVIQVADEFIELRQAVKSIPTFERRLFGEQIDAGELTVNQLLQWRRQLSTTSAKADNFAQRELARELIEALDGSISDAVDPALHNLARAQWRMLFALEGGKSYTKQSINPTSFITSLNRIYGRDFSLQRTQGLTDEVRQVLEAAAEIENLGVTIPSSGTAERAAGAALLFGTGAIIATRE